MRRIANRGWRDATQSRFSILNPAIDRARVEAHEPRASTQSKERADGLTLDVVLVSPSRQGRSERTTDWVSGTSFSWSLEGQQKLPRLQLHLAAVGTRRKEHSASIHQSNPPRHSVETHRNPPIACNRVTGRRSSRGGQEDTCARTFCLSSCFLRLDMHMCR